MYKIKLTKLAIEKLNDIESKTRNQIINNAIDALPEKCRIVFQLRRIEGSSHQEIADKLGISKKTIENHLTKAMKILRETLQSKFLE